jgi:hypothetical protein
MSVTSVRDGEGIDDRDESAASGIGVLQAAG